MHHRFSKWRRGQSGSSQLPKILTSNQPIYVHVEISNFTRKITKKECYQKKGERGRAAHSPWFYVPVLREFHRKRSSLRLPRTSKIAEIGYLINKEFTVNDFCSADSYLRQAIRFSPIFFFWSFLGRILNVADRLQ